MNDENQHRKGADFITSTPLTNEEIEIVKQEIRKIKADESIFVFNDPEHIQASTCYNFVDDKVYVTRNVFPDIKYGSTHPRDLMSIRAVLAHEYYGHRSFREEYIRDRESGNQTKTIWEDECRASIVAAKTTPNLTIQDKSNLIMDAVYRAEEFSQHIELDSFMKEVLYGYTDGEKNITTPFDRIKFVSKESEKRD